MHPIAYVIMAFGAGLCIFGLVLFAMKGAEGTNVVKMLGFEFHLTGSSLVVFVVGAVMFLFPIMYSEKFPRTTPHVQYERNNENDRSIKDQPSPQVPVASYNAKLDQTLRELQGDRARTDAELFELLDIQFRMGMEQELEDRGRDTKLAYELSLPKLEKLARDWGIVQ